MPTDNPFQSNCDDGCDDDDTMNVLWRHSFTTHLGQKIRQRRKELGLSQTALGLMVGLTFQQVQKYEHGANRLSALRLIEIAQATGVQPGYFFDNFPHRPNGHPGAPDESHVNQSDSESGYANSHETAELADLFSRINNPALRLNLIEIARGLSKTI